MTAPEISLEQVEAEETELQFAGFSEDDAWELGSALVRTARSAGAPVAVDVTRHGHQLFHAALPGSSPDNDRWIERTARVVDRFGHSSLYVRLLCERDGTTMAEKFLLDPREYAAHGGAFPLLVRKVGPVGTVVVSGLPQLEDHRMVVAALREHLARTRA